MKKLIFTIAILAFTAFGTWKCAETTTTETTKCLDCADLISTRTDETTGEFIATSKEELIISEDGGKTGFRISAMSITGLLFLDIKVVGLRRHEYDDNKMDVLFRDGTRLELVTRGTSYPTAFEVSFGGSFEEEEKEAKELEIFGKKEVETMRIWTSNRYVEKDFSSDQSKQLMKTFDCLLNQ